MKRAYLVQVEIDEAELANLNSKRKRQGQQSYEADGFIDNLVVDALTRDKLLSGATCVPAQRTTFVDSNPSILEEREGG